MQIRNFVILFNLAILLIERVIVVRYKKKLYKLVEKSVNIYM